MKNKDEFNSNRLKYARIKRGYTLKKLSERLSISTKILSLYENGHSAPSKQHMIKSISEILNFPIDFFYMDDIASLEETIVSFRSLARMSASTKNAALCSGQLALELVQWISEKITLPKIEVPDLNKESPEAAAVEIRTQWALGEKPIKNLIHLFEAKGIYVFSLNQPTLDMDAYSFWIDNKAYIFLNTLKTAERSRFDAAHELGHLVLHKHGSPTGKIAEIEANRFASAFLMPEGDVRQRTHQFVSLEDIILLKSCWLVAASALIRRLKDLQIITEWQYRSFNIELSKQGYRTKEPKPLKCRETSKLIPMIFKILREDGLSKTDIAKDLGVYKKEIDELFFHLDLTEIDGGMVGNESYKANKPNLRVIK